MVGRATRGGGPDATEIGADGLSPPRIRSSENPLRIGNFRVEMSLTVSTRWAVTSVTGKPVAGRGFGATAAGRCDSGAAVLLESRVPPIRIVFGESAGTT